MLALILFNGCPYYKRKFIYRDGHEEKNDDVNTQGISLDEDENRDWSDVSWQTSEV